MLRHETVKHSLTVNGFVLFLVVSGSRLCWIQAGLSYVKHFEWLKGAIQINLPWLEKNSDLNDVTPVLRKLWRTKCTFFWHFTDQQIHHDAQHVQKPAAVLCIYEWIKITCFSFLLSSSIKLSVCCSVWNANTIWHDFLMKFDTFSWFNQPECDLCDTVNGVKAAYMEHVAALSLCDGSGRHYRRCYTSSTSTTYTLIWLVQTTTTTHTPDDVVMDKTAAGETLESRKGQNTHFHGNRKSLRPPSKGFPSF